MITVKLQPEPNKAVVKLKGGPGSGHHGHSGRQGKHGGSLPGSSARVSFGEISPEFIDPHTGLISALEEVSQWDGFRADIGQSTIDHINTGSHGIIFRHNGEMVGVASYAVEGNSLYLGYFATKRPGYGRSSMVHMAQLANSLGAENLTLVSHNSAIGFYEKLGLERLGETNAFVWQMDAMLYHLEAVVIEKSLVDDEPANGVFTVGFYKEQRVLIGLPAN